MHCKKVYIRIFPDIRNMEQGSKNKKEEKDKNKTKKTNYNGGEEYFCRSSRKIYLPLYLMVLFLLFLIWFIRSRNLNLNPAAYTGAIIFIITALIFSEIHRMTIYYKIGDDYIARSTGIISTTIKSVAFPSISDIDLKQNFWQRLLKYGNVFIYQYGAGNVTRIKNINKPEKFLNIVLAKRANFGEE